jgi:DNA polymerase III gamma/tau subunit
LEEFDNASFEAQNAFLKLLEEPPDNVEFALVVSNTYSILPTVISRTKIIRLEKEKTSPLELSISKALEAFTAKKTSSALNFSLFTTQSKEDSLETIKQLSLFFHNRLSKDNLAPSILSEIIRVNGLLKQNNLNHQLAIDHLLIFILKKYSMKL